MTNWYKTSWTDFQEEKIREGYRFYQEELNRQLDEATLPQQEALDRIKRGEPFGDKIGNGEKIPKEFRGIPNEAPRRVVRDNNDHEEEPDEIITFGGLAIVPFS